MANQALQNLKRIHDLQKDGEISKILQELRASKIKVDELSANLSKRNKEIEAERIAKQQALEIKPEEKVEIKKEVQINEVKEVEPAFVDRKQQDKNTNFNACNNIKLLCGMHSL